VRPVSGRPGDGEARGGALVSLEDAADLPLYRRWIERIR
jgi:hypothetical protein